MNVWTSLGGGKYSVKSFNPPSGYTVGSNGYKFMVGDFNGDGKSDLIHFVGPTYARIWISQGGGNFNVLESFRPHATYSIDAN